MGRFVSSSGRARVPPFKSGLPPFAARSSRSSTTARNADRAAMFELTWSSAVFRSICTLPFWQTCSQNLPFWQRVGGANQGKKSSKVNRDCTICASCPWAISDTTVLERLENRLRMAGIGLAPDALADGR